MIEKVDPSPGRWCRPHRWVSPVMDVPERLLSRSGRLDPAPWPACQAL